MGLVEVLGYKVDWAVLVCPFLLPISVIWDLIVLWRIKIRFWISEATGQKVRLHQEKVQRVQEQVRAWRTEGNGRKMCTARPSWMSISQQKLGYKDWMYRVRVDNMQDIVDIDKASLMVTVEPGVTIGHLNRVLVEQGLTLPVVPELDVLTVGGLLMGGGIESTSHKWGLFHQTCTEYEVVTADGECLVATADNKNSDLFSALPMSYGTLGFITSAKLQAVRYKPFIKLRFLPTRSLEETTKVFERETNASVGNDSVEGIAFSKDTAVVMTGTFVEEKEVEKDKINKMGLWYKPWFYQHVRSFLDQGPTTEYVPTLHFHQRHNKPCFWLTKLWLPWAEAPLARFLTGWALPLNHQLLQLLRDSLLEEQQEENSVLQDFIIPVSRLKEGVELTEKITGIYPLWMVPTKLEHTEEDMFVDLGVYGNSHLEDFPGKDETLRKFERFTLEVGGFQALYAETLLTYSQFTKMFKVGMERYWKVRERLPLTQEAFPEVYDKVSREGRDRVRREAKGEGVKTK